MTRKFPRRPASARGPHDDGGKPVSFWPAPEALASLSDDEARRLLELRRELASGEHGRAEGLSKLRKELRKKRLEQLRARRHTEAVERTEARAARRDAWQRAKQSQVRYLGRGVSGGLSRDGGDEARLVRQGLPVLPSPEALADALGLDRGQLRFLCYERTVSAVTHYARFQVPKKTGGTRIISAPMPRLKAVQRWLLDHVLEAPAMHDAAHGFAPGRSIVSNARPHVGAGIVVNLDLSDFFPTIVYPRVKGLFVALGYGESTATALALLCTEADKTQILLGGERLYVAEGPRRLPQGAPTSPALSNLLCRRLDRRLAGLARKRGFVYTRYADDLTFSGARDADVGILLRDAHRIIVDEGFVVRPDKTRVLRRGGKQEVTGLTVNDRLGVDRKTLRRFRALLHQMEQTGPDGKRWGAGGNVLSAARGFASFVAMVDADKGRALLAQVAALETRYGAPASREQPLTPGAPAPSEATLDPHAADATEDAASVYPTETLPVEQVVTVKRWWKRG